MRKSSIRRRALVCLVLLLVVGMAASVCFLRTETGRRFVIAVSGARISPVYQTDYRTPVRFSGGETSVASSGCGVTCLSMVIGHLTGDTEQTPQTLFELACKIGEYQGGGLTHGSLSRLAQRYALDSVWIDDVDALRDALSRGRPVIAHMGKGNFTESGHYILLRGLTPLGKVVLNDPNSPENTWTTFDLATIVEQSKSNSPFMLLDRE